MSSAPSPAALRAAAVLYFADEALSAVRHDVLNRLTAIGAVGYELRGLLSAEEPGAPGPRRERLGDLNRQIGLISQTVARRLTPPRDPQATTGLAVAARAAVAACARPDKVQVASSPDLQVTASSTEVAIMLLLLLDNGLESTVDPEAGSEQVAPVPVVRIDWQVNQDGEAEIVVEDEGPGLSVEARDRAFERFFTSKPGHAGLGLGVVRTLSTRAGGQSSVEAARRSISGTLVRLILPLAGQAEEQEGREG